MNEKTKILKAKEKNPAKKDRDVFLSVSESAKLIGVNQKTIRRAIKDKKIRYRINNNRYAIKFSSLLNFARSSTKLKNKLHTYGIGKYLK